MSVRLLNWAFYHYLRVFGTNNTGLEESHLALRADRSADIRRQKMMIHLLLVSETEHEQDSILLLLLLLLLLLYLSPLFRVFTITYLKETIIVALQLFCSYSVWYM